jgi:hypothetical protein
MVARRREELLTGNKRQQDLKDELGVLSRQRVDLQLEIESLRKDLNFYRKTSILIILTCLTGFIGLIFWKTK